MIKIISIKRVELTNVEPVSLADIKIHLNITDSDNDIKLNNLNSQCRRSIEEYCNISIIAKRIELIADFKQEWELPYGPVSGLEQVASRDSNIGSGMPDYNTVESGWNLEGDSFMMWPATGDIFQSKRNYPFRLKLTYTAGYDIVPQALILGILNEIAYRYTHLGDQDAGNKVRDDEAKKIVQPFIRMQWL